MTQVHERPPTTTTLPGPNGRGNTRGQAQVPIWQLNLLRVGYLFMGGGLAVVKWPLLADSQSWSLEEGTIEILLIAMSVLALLGLRYPIRMLPILLFEVTWKAIWLGVVALPLWLDDKLEGDTRTQAGTLLLVAVIVAVIPWRHVVTRYVLAPAEPLRRSR